MGSPTYIQRALRPRWGRRYTQTRKSQQAARGAFFKKLDCALSAFFGVPKGALGAVSIREYGAPRLAPGRDFWASLPSRMRKTTFFCARKSEKNSGAPALLRCRGPLGAPIFAFTIQGCAHRDASWRSFGVPEGPPYSRKFEKCRFLMTSLQLMTSSINENLSFWRQNVKKLFIFS